MAKILNNFGGLVLAAIMLQPLIAVLGVHAEETALDPAVVQELAKEINNTVMSPFCPGVTISACTSPNARKLREDVFAWFEHGLTEEQVRERLVNRFGKQVLGVPDREGFGALGWLMPIVVVLLGAIVIVRFLGGKSKKDADDAGSPPSDVSPELAERIEKELLDRMG